MYENFGVDFGTATSEVARFDPVSKRPSALTLGNASSPCVPSVARRKDKETLCFGFDCRTGEPVTAVEMKAFKMLLGENGEAVDLKSRGYGNFTPKQVASQFLNDLLLQALNTEKVRTGKDVELGNLVICIPELWTTADRDNGPTNELRDICCSLENIHPESLRIITEPEAASAYVAYNYLMDKREPFSGHILLIDYGGGTLDLTLVEVRQAEDGGTEIISRAKCGAGDNHKKGQIGAAGVAYVEKVTELAVLAAHPELASANLKNDRKLAAAVRQFEAVFIAHGKNVADFEACVKKYGIHPERLAKDSQVFCKLDYNPVYDEEEGCDLSDVTVTYAMLYNAYAEVIEPVLKKQLAAIVEKSAKYADAAHIDLDLNNKKQPALKIAIVGGFGQFILVENQVKKFFHIEFDTDVRLDKEISRNKSTAVAMGAALVAEKKVTIVKSAPYSLGIVYNFAWANNSRFSYAILRGDIMNDNVIYFTRKDAANSAPDENPIPITYSPSKNHPLIFATNIDSNAKYAYPRGPASRYLDELNDKFTADKLVCVGFSMDSTGVIQVHIHDAIIEGNKCRVGSSLLKKPIRLDSFKEVFGSTLSWDPNDSISL